MKRKGFTLIELLVVITIIVILAAILFPVFAKAKERGRQAECTSNLRQIAQAVAMYVDHYDELYPPVWYYTDRLVGKTPEFTTTDGYITWMDMIYPYIKNVNVFKCPDCQWNTTPPGPVSLSTLATAYGINTYGIISGQRIGLCGIGVWPQAGFIKSVATSEISKPADTIMVGDVVGPGEEVYPEALGATAITGVVGYGSRLTPVDLDVNDRYQYASSRHDGGANVAFCDTHVKWMEQEMAVAKYNYRAVKN